MQLFHSFQLKFQSFNGGLIIVQFNVWNSWISFDELPKELQIYNWLVLVQELCLVIVLGLR